MNIHKTYEMPFPVESVFAAWISNDAIVPPITSVEIEPEVGGVFRLDLQSAAGASAMQGRILHFEENQRLRYSWTWSGSSDTSVVDVSFSAHNGQTRVELSHSGLHSVEMIESHEKGWDDYIGGLTSYLGDNVVIE